MKPEHLISEARKKAAGSKPTSFASIKQNAVTAFDLEPKNVAGKEKWVAKESSFRVNLKSDEKNRSDVYQYSTFDLSKKDAETLAKETFIDRLKTENPRRYKDLKLNDIGVERYKENDPRIKDGKLQPNVVKTNIERVRDYAAQFRNVENVLSIRRVKQAGAVTVGTVLDQIKQDSDQAKFPYYKTFLGHLISRAGQSFEPVVLIDNYEQFMRAGFKDGSKANISELINDFGEIAGPIGLVCQSINGNAVRVLAQFLKLPDGTVPTVTDLMREATIHYHASQGHMLVDSYIEYRGKVVRVSSKGAGEALSGGQGASVDGIFKSMDEIVANPEAKQRFEQLIARKPKYTDVMNKLRLIARAFDQSELDLGMKGYVTQFRLLAELNGQDPSIAVTDQDIEILKEIWAASGDSDVGMHDFKFLIGTALGNRPDVDYTRDANQQFSGRQFTPEFQQILRTFNLNRYGEPGTSGVEKLKSGDDTNAKRGWWRRLKKALVYNISKNINSDPKFSELATWILNHGAFCQIDTRYREQEQQGVKALVVNNMTATWPSTAVDRVKLLPLPSGEGFRYKLDINGGTGWSDKQYQQRVSAGSNDLDYDFGFTNKRERERNRIDMLPTQRDLARNTKDWMAMGTVDAQGTGTGDQRTKPRGMLLPRTRGQDRLRDTRANLAMRGFYKDLADNGIIQEVPKTAEQAALTVSNLGLQIVNGYAPEQLSRDVNYTLNAVWGMRSQFDTELSENDDDDDDLDTVKLIGREQLLARDRAVHDATVAKTVLMQLYTALRVNRQLILLNQQQQDPNSNRDYLSLKDELKRWTLALNNNIWPRYEQVLSAREQGQEPAHTQTPADTVPVKRKSTVDNRPTAVAQQEPDEVAAIMRPGRGRPRTRFDRQAMNDKLFELPTATRQRFFKFVELAMRRGYTQDQAMSKLDRWLQTQGR